MTLSLPQNGCLRKNWTNLGSAPFSPPSDPAQRLHQGPPAKSKFLAAARKILRFFSRPSIALALCLLLTPAPVQAGEINVLGYGAEWSSSIDGSWQPLTNLDFDFEDYQFELPIDGGSKFMRLSVNEN